MPVRVREKNPQQERMEAIYAFIELFYMQHRMTPTQREIAEECYLSRGTVLRYLDLLEARGLIERTPFKARSIRLVESPQRNRL